MRHRKDHRVFDRYSEHRTAMFRNMVTSLLEWERIETTVEKAKDLRRIAEKMITLGKKGGLANLRRALRTVKQKEVAHKLFGPLAERYRDRPGGYTRIIKTGRRLGDGARMAIIELVDTAPLAPRKVKEKGEAKKPEKAEARKPEKEKSKKPDKEKAKKAEKTEKSKQKEAPKKKAKAEAKKSGKAES